MAANPGTGFFWTKPSRRKSHFDSQQCYATCSGARYLVGNEGAVEGNDSYFVRLLPSGKFGQKLFTQYDINQDTANVAPTYAYKQPPLSTPGIPFNSLSSDDETKFCEFEAQSQDDTNIPPLNWAKTLTLAQEFKNSGQMAADAALQLWKCSNARLGIDVDESKATRRRGPNPLEASGGGSATNTSDAGTGQLDATTIDIAEESKEQSGLKLSNLAD